MVREVQTGQVDRVLDRDRRYPAIPHVRVSRDLRPSARHREQGPPDAVQHAGWHVCTEPGVQPHRPREAPHSAPPFAARERDLHRPQEVLGLERTGPRTTVEVPVKLLREPPPDLGARRRREPAGSGEGPDLEVHVELLRDGAVVLSELVENLADVRESILSAHPKPKLDVLRMAEQRIVAPGVDDGLSSDHHGAVHEGTHPAEELLDHPFVARVWRKPAERLSLGIDQQRARAKNRDLGVLIQEPHLPAESFRQRQVVRILAGDELSTRHLEAPVPGDGVTPVLLAHEDDPRVLEARRHVPGAVGRAVVDDDELEVTERLTENALYRGNEKVSAVEDTHDDGNPGHGSQPSAPRLRQPQDLALRHASRRRSPAPPRLPGRVHLPIQPAPNPMAAFQTLLGLATLHGPTSLCA